jgi:hypothetical protein
MPGAVSNPTGQTQLMPKKNLASFQVQRILDGTATVKEFVKERLDPLKAEPENKERQDDLYNFCVEVLVTIERERERISSAPKPLPSPVEDHTRHMATRHTSISEKKTKIF